MQFAANNESLQLVFNFLLLFHHNADIPVRAPAPLKPFKKAFSFDSARTHYRT
jgi:hypothetical protein